MNENLFWQYWKISLKFREISNFEIPYAVFYSIFNFRPYLVQLNAVNNTINILQIILFEGQKQPCRGFLRKRCLKICRKFTGEHPCQSAISIKLQTNFIEITLRHGCSSVNLLHIFRTPFPKNTSEWLLLEGYFFDKFDKSYTW